MMYRLAFAAFALLANAAEISEEDNRVLGEMLDFVELNIANLLRQGQYPAVYNASWPKVKECGCYYMPSKITWGSEIGLQCARQFPDEATEGMAQEYDPETCGPLCNNHHNLDVVLFCPMGWERDCTKGCVPPPQFDDVEARIDFWEFTITSMLLYGQDYVNIDSDYLKECGCESKPRPIRYGTKIGFDCIMEEDGEMQPGCRASAQCADEAGRQVVTFCPAGHATTCNGCDKDLDTDDPKERLEWMVHTIEGVTQLSLPMLRWTPMFEQVLGCGCKSGVKPIKYGTKVGFVCEINGPDFITQDCGPNVICKNGDGADIIHMCPQGYIPSCKNGCDNPILRRQGKEEL